MSAGQALKAVATDQTPTKATQNPAVEALNKALAGIGQVLPAHITKERMAKLCLGMMRTNAKLAQAARRNPASFVNSIMHASKLGLEPGIDAHLVPYENKRQGTVEIQCIPDYRGLLKLARNSGDITSVSVQIVYEHDHFELSLGLVETLTHKPKLDGPRGDPVLVYGVARFKDGSHHVEWMSVQDINTIRDGSRGYQNAVRYKSDNPWISSWEEMARKTLVRRMCKYLPRSIELQNAERLIDAGDKGVPAHFEGEFVVVEDDGGAGGEETGGGQVEDKTKTSDDLDTRQDADLKAGIERQSDDAPTGPSLQDALALVAKGDDAGAQDLAGQLGPAAKAAVAEAIEKRNGAQQPQQRSARRPARDIAAE
jgi:recombination protein RecT